MKKKLLILNLLFFLVLQPAVNSQVRSSFTGDPLKFREELLNYMGTDLLTEHKTIIDNFLLNWDNEKFSKENRTSIIDLSSQLSARQFRAVPQYVELLKTLNDFIDYKNDEPFLRYWLAGFSEMLFGQNITNAGIVLFLKNTSLLIKENVLINSGSVKWKVKNAELNFEHDTVFQIVVNDATLTCYSQRDSTEIYNVTGIYYPDLQIFHGNKGIVTWEKAGYPRSDVVAELKDFRINTLRNGFTSDSARLMHKAYFDEPVYGILTDQAASISNKEKAAFPRFETYTKHFKIDNIYKGVDYEGGLAFEGSSVKGNGEKQIPARMKFYRNDTLLVKLASTEFVFTASGITSMQTIATIYLGNDSIFHTNLGLSFNAANRQVNIFKTNNPVSGSPYFNSYHNLDMYFEYMSWNMNESKIIISRARGAALGQALFESVAFFNSDYFFKLMGLDEYHPLTLLKQFSEWYYSETFPVSEFAKWLNKPEEPVTGMCIDLASRGFIFYDRTNNEVTIKKKVFDFIDSFAGKKDYDVFTVFSETKAPADNAILDLKDFDLTVNGVREVFLSDSQKVAIYPYGQQLIIGKNRSFKFNGIVHAGLFAFYGHDFHFSYDTFKLRLEKIDSIKIAVETEKRDLFGNPVTEIINNLIQLTRAELYIDDPDNKSGLKSLQQYPIVNATDFSYIFYDKIQGLEDIYSKKDFYFRIDPFSYENIDHYKIEDMSLKGEFYAGNILKPMIQYLTIQNDNSLGFRMAIPDEGIEVYGGKGILSDSISMSNHGLIGCGNLRHLSSTTFSKEYRYFPDSMITRTLSFKITNDGSGIFPDLTGEEIQIKWLPDEDRWLAVNTDEKHFSMFNNGTSLDGQIELTPSLVLGEGIINMPDSRITSHQFNFTSNSVRADTADYNLKSSSTGGYAFIAENAKTDINFDLRKSLFHLNTDSSVVKFPEIQYICKMTDFEYEMEGKILNMEHRDRSSAAGLISPREMLKVNLSDPEDPTFIATDNLTDTITFNSRKARYHVDEEYIEAESINYIPVADALIQPENGRIIIDRRAKIRKLENAVIAVNNLHILRSANINIESAKSYSGSAIYDYIDDTNETRPIIFNEINIDTLTTSAKGYIPADQKFMLSHAFSFTGDVSLSARSDKLLFTGSAGIIHDCNSVLSNTIKFKGPVDPENVMIPVGDKPRDDNDNLVYSGSFLNIDSSYIYPSFLSPQKSWTDVQFVKAQGYLYYNKLKGQYTISSAEKIADPSLHGNIVVFDRNLCTISGEGRLDLGADFDLMKMTSAGNYKHNTDSGKVTIESILALNFYFSPEALRIMTEEIKLMPTLQPVNLNSTFNKKGMKDLLGENAANKLRDELNLFGLTKNLPEEYIFELLLNDVKLYWNEFTTSFRSTGKIGIGFIGSQPINVYVDGYIEIQRRRSGDMIDIYLKANESTWYYFSYFRGVMMAQSGNMNFNSTISNEKLRDRRHPNSSVKIPYTYMIAVEDRLARFLRRMSVEKEEETDSIDGLFR